MHPSLSRRAQTITIAFLLFTMLFALKLPTVESQTAQRGTIKVGVYVDLTGQTSSFGVSTRNGIQMAADEINKAGGIAGREIHLVVEDDEGVPIKAYEAVARLISRDKVDAILGEVTSTNTFAAAWQAQMAGVPMITPAATNPRVTLVGDYIFRTCFIDPLQGTAAAKFAVKTLHANRAAILTDANSEYSRGLDDAFTREFRRLGGRIVKQQSYMQSDQSFSGQLIEIRAAKPDVIFMPGYYSEVGVIARQARRLGIKATILGGDGWDAPQLWAFGGRALNGSYMTNHFSAESPLPLTRRFVAAYRARYKSSPDAIAALGYDAMMVLADALKRAGTTDGRKLRDAIAQTRDFPGVTGNITIDADRNAVKPVVIFKLWGGKFLYHSTIFPEAAPRFLRAGLKNAPNPAFLPPFGQPKF